MGGLVCECVSGEGGGGVGVAHVRVCFVSRGTRACDWWRGGWLGGDSKAQVHSVRVARADRGRAESVKYSLNGIYKQKKQQVWDSWTCIYGAGVRNPGFQTPSWSEHTDGPNLRTHAVLIGAA